MADTTQHIGLKKPLGNESADIVIVNENMDKIDQALGSVSTVPTTAKNLAGAIAELHADIESAVTGLVNGAPAFMDTLKELATALGNDPSFATTITNALSSKASISYVDAQVATARTYQP